jgi:hypothetical protein
MTVDLAARVTIAPDVLIQHLDDESVLLNVRSGKYFGLDSVGTRAWQLVTTAPTVADALTSMASEYDVGYDVLRSDVEELLSQLVNLGLVTLSEPKAIVP